MNEHEIDSAVRKYRPETPSGRAAQFLSDFRHEVNAHSDGWCYWKAPVTASAKLIQFLTGPEDAVTRSEKALKVALVPIRSFMTRRGNAAGMTMPKIEVGA
jgi:hypothetical protein